MIQVPHKNAAARQSTNDKPKLCGSNIVDDRIVIKNMEASKSLACSTECTCTVLHMMEMPKNIHFTSHTDVEISPCDSRLLPLLWYCCK